MKSLHAVATILGFRRPIKLTCPLIHSQARGRETCDWRQKAEAFTKWTIGYNDQYKVEQSFHACERTLINWLAASLNDADAARDVAQNTFLKVWIYAEQNSVSHARRLIFKTAARLALDEIRRRKRFRQRIIFADDMSEASAMNSAPSGDRSPEESAAIKQAAQLTLRAIKSLPPKTRTAFLLHRFDGFNYREIAEKMDVSKSSVEKYIINALSHLRSAMPSEAIHRVPNRKPQHIVKVESEALY